MKGIQLLRVLALWGLMTPAIATTKSLENQNEQVLLKNQLQDYVYSQVHYAGGDSSDRLTIFPNGQFTITIPKNSTFHHVTFTAAGKDLECQMLRPTEHDKLERFYAWISKDKQHKVACYFWDFKRDND